jgi:hypothetical protein
MLRPIHFIYPFFIIKLGMASYDGVYDILTSCTAVTLPVGRTLRTLSVGARLKPDSRDI